MAAPHSGAVVFGHRGEKLLGILNRPGGRPKARRPAVLFLHGFPGAEKNVDVQRRLLDRGIASFAPHFSGCWGSGGVYEFSRLVEQSRAALNFMAAQEFVDSKRMAVFGFSMGGWAALNLAALEPKLRAVAAVSPVGGPEMIKGLSRERIAHLGRVLTIRSVSSLTADFRRAVTVQDPARAVAKLACPLLLVHGDGDEVVPAGVSRRLFTAAHQPKKLVIARGAGHDYLDRRPWLTALTGDWLARYL